MSDIHLDMGKTNTSNVADNVSSQVKLAIDSVANRACQKAIQLAPKKSGFLHRSIITTPGGINTDVKEPIISPHTKAMFSALNVIRNRRPGTVGVYKSSVEDISNISAFSGSEEPKPMIGRDKYSVGIEAGAEYAGAVEFGHGGVPAKPFFRPAMEWAASVLDDEVAKAVNEGVTNVRI